LAISFFCHKAQAEQDFVSTPDRMENANKDRA
jgi:hypothetical protein